MWRHTLSPLILLLATLQFPGTSELKSSQFPFLSARTTHRKHSPSIFAWCRPHRRHVSRVKLRVHWFVTNAGNGADDIENTASFIAACWTVFPELLPSNTLIKFVTIRLNCPKSWIFSIFILTFYLKTVCKSSLVNSAFHRPSRIKHVINFETAWRIGARCNLICISVPSDYRGLRRRRIFLVINEFRGWFEME
jgi:hypothetical protein